MTQAPPRRIQVKADLGWWGLLAALLVAVVTLFWRLTAVSLQTDEAFSFGMARLGYAALLHTVTALDYHPPLFYLATHLAMSALHWPLWNYRYLTAPFGLLTVVATWGAGRRIGGGVAAGVAALLVALAPGLLAYDRMYRMYAVLVAMSTLSWWLLVELERAVGKTRAILFAAYAATCVVLAYTHYLGLLMLACQALFVLTRRQKLWPAFAAYVLVAIAYVPWLAHVRQQLTLGGLSEGRPGVDSGLAASVSSAFALGLPSFGPAHTADWLVTILVVGIMAAGFGLGRQSALPWWLAAFVIAVAASIIFGKNLAYFPRYLLVEVPPVAIALGLIASTLASRGKTVASFVVAVVPIALGTLCTVNLLYDPYYQFPDWYAVNATIAAHERRSDAFVLDAAYEYLVVADFSAFRDHPVLSFMNPSDFSPVLKWIAAHPAVRVWYVQHQNFYWDPRLRIRSALAGRPLLFAADFSRQLPVNDVAVMLFDKVPMTK